MAFFSAFTRRLAVFLVVVAQTPLTHDSVELVVFIDHSIIEIFVNDVFALTARAYPTTADSDGVRLRSSGGATVSVATWQLAP